MKKSDVLVMATFAGALAVGAVVSAPAYAGENEKCTGVVKAGKNDCAYGTNSCAGSATKDGEKDAWIYVPKGTCAKIIGGTVVDKK
jgi:uncharacterized membrane protein